MGIELKDKLTENSVKINGKTFKHRISENKIFGKVETWVYPDGGSILKTDDDRYTALIWLRTDTGDRMTGREARNTLEEAADVVISAAEDMNMKDAKMEDDYGWEIPSKKAWQAFESLKEEMGSKNLFLEMRAALGEDDWKELIADVAHDYDEDTDDSDILLEYFDFEEIIDDVARKLSSDDLAENLAYICKMNNVHIPELKAAIEDALWINPDNDAPSAGRLTLRRPIRYGDYLILTRKDGLFDVYTVGSYDLVGTEFESIDEAKRNIDEGRTEENSPVVTEEDDEFVEVKPDPERKDINYKGFRIKKQPSGRWRISSAGEGIGERKDLVETPNFSAAVDYLFKHTAAPKPTGNDAISDLLRKYMQEA